jgi:hypothetical protein
MHPSRFHRMIGDVSREFEHPRAILGDHELSTEQKIRLLKEWELDLRELQVAAEENMIDENSPGTTGELLQECRRALNQLDATDAEGGGVPTKTGASG